MQFVGFWESCVSSYRYMGTAFGQESFQNVVYFQFQLVKEELRMHANVKFQNILFHLHWNLVFF
jgi:hypothetical protein